MGFWVGSAGIVGLGFLPVMSEVLSEEVAYYLFTCLWIGCSSNIVSVWLYCVTPFLRYCASVGNRFREVLVDRSEYCELGSVCVLWNLEGFAGFVGLGMWVVFRRFMVSTCDEAELFSSIRGGRVIVSRALDRMLQQCSVGMPLMA